MNWDYISGNWKQISGKVRETWGRLTDDDLAEIQGRYEGLIGKIQVRYGAAREEAERQVREWSEALKPRGQAS